MNERATDRERYGESGFTLAELLVSMAVMVVVLLAMLALFDSTNKFAKAETNVADTQQSVRVAQDEIVRLTREVGRGWETGGVGRLDPTQAISVDDNVGPAVYIGTSSSDPSLKVLPGTDVLHLRGVMRGALYASQSEVHLPAGATNGCKGTADNGWNTCNSTSFSSDAATNTAVISLPACPAWSGCAGPAATGFKQDLTTFVPKAGDVAFLVGNNGQIAMYAAKSYTSGELTLDTSTEKSGPWTVGNGGHAISANQRVLDSGVALTGLFEDFAIYIRENGGQPKLSVARYVPGTKDPFQGDLTNLKQDIADDIVDLQVALGIGTPNTSTYTWYCNIPSAGTCAPPAFDATHSLFYARVNVLGRTAGRDFHYVSPAIATVENHTYAEPAQPANDADAVTRSYHRRLLRTIIDARNL